jgi:hypothetical protein
LLCAPRSRPVPSSFRDLKANSLGLRFSFIGEKQLMGLVGNSRTGPQTGRSIGTSIVRALEAAANAGGTVRPGTGVASGRIARGAPLRIVDAILTGVH